MQAGIETAMGLGTVARAGVHFLMHGTGVLSAFNAVSFEKFIIDDELVGMIRARNLPVEVDDDTLALDSIDVVGPGGNYLQEPHTLEHCRDYEHPTFFNRRRHDVWVSRGGSDLATAARRHLQCVVDGWEEPEMDASIRHRLAETALADPSARARFCAAFGVPALRRAMAGPFLRAGGDLPGLGVGGRPADGGRGAASHPRDRP